ncbi:MAG: rRNA maturation RNase YbeY [bacterium]|nr:rRNA maturation RNase YbeY [bacterium]
MNIEINNHSKQKINNKLIRQAADKFAKKFKLAEKDVSVAFVSEKKIKELNRKYRGKNAVTDILSFADGEHNFLGELIICPTRLERQAKQRFVSIQKEYVFIFTHGLLHLIGYSDETQSGYEEMVKIQELLCKSLLEKKP